MVTPLAKKKHASALSKTIKEIEAFYAKAFPGELSAPEVFWDFIGKCEAELQNSLVESGENSGKIKRACDEFTAKFKKACVRARQILDGKPSGVLDPEGRTQPGGEAARKALEDAKRPADYRLW